MKQTEDTQVVVLMGGLGKRLNKKLPKAMVDVCGKPFFNYQLNLMKQAGFKNFLFCVGYKAEVIKNYFKDGKEFGVSITYSLDNALGTAGALKNAYEYLDEDFMLIYGDSFMDVNYSEIITAYYKLKIKAMIAVIKNENLYDKSNVILRDGGIINYIKNSPVLKMNYVDYGIAMLNRCLLDNLLEDTFINLSDCYSSWSNQKLMWAHKVYNRFYEIGTKESLQEFKEYIIDNMEVFNGRTKNN